MSFRKQRRQSTLKLGRKKKTNYPVAIRRSEVNSAEKFHEFFILGSLKFQDLTFTVTHT